MVRKRDPRLATGFLGLDDSQPTRNPRHVLPTTSDWDEVRPANSYQPIA